MKEYEDTLQVCTLHRILQTLNEPCPRCLEDIRREKEARELSERAQALATAA
jgi:hypothetical protein